MERMFILHEKGHLVASCVPSGLALPPCSGHEHAARDLGLASHVLADMGQ